MKRAPSKRAPSKELRELLKVITDQPGFSVRVSRGGHYIVAKDGRTVAVIAGTPSDRRSWLNTLADLRRAGAAIPRKGQK